jgi:hypothetical protein
MPLTNIQVEEAKPRDKNWKLFDEERAVSARQQGRLQMVATQVPLRRSR